MRNVWPPCISFFLITIDQEKKKLGYEHVSRIAKYSVFLSKKRPKLKKGDFKNPVTL